MSEIRRLVNAIVPNLFGAGRSVEIERGPRGGVVCGLVDDAPPFSAYIVRKAIREELIDREGAPTGKALERYYDYHAPEPKVA